MTRERTRRTILAVIGTVMWLGYTFVGLPVIDRLAPTLNGNGPEGTAAFVSLVSGIVVVGLIQWAASE